MKKVMSFEDAIAHHNAAPVLKKFGLLTPDGEYNETIKLSTYKKELIVFGIEHWGQEVCATLWSLAIPVGRMYRGARGHNNKNNFDKDRKDQPIKHGIIKDKAGKRYSMVEIAYFLDVNWDFENGGRFFEYHETETEIAQKLIAEDKHERIERQKEEDTANKAFKSGVASMARGGAATKHEAPALPKTTKTWVVNVDMSLEEYVGDPKDFDADNYLAHGSKAHCNKYLTDQKALEKKKVDK